MPCFSPTITPTVVLVHTNHSTREFSDKGLLSLAKTNPNRATGIFILVGLYIKDLN